MAVVAEGFTYMRDAEPSFWGGEGRLAMQAWIRKTISKSAQLTYTPINTRVIGNFALLLRMGDGETSRPKRRRKTNHLPLLSNLGKIARWRVAHGIFHL